MSKKRISDLIVKDLRGVLTVDEQVELQEWLDLSESNRNWYEHMCKSRNWLNYPALIERGEAKKAAVLVRVEEFMEGQQEPGAKIVSLWWRQPFFRVAAAVVVLLAVGAVWHFLSNQRSASPELQVIVKYKNDAPPGTNKAILTLANGSTIALNSAGNGALTRQGNTQVLKVDSGEIAYRPSNSGPKEVLYNTISTPKGGQYRLVLADGSKVWLNAATTLRFPIAFNGSGRSVELITGEAYFEIVHQANHPFTVRIRPVRSDKQDLALQVLGTSFDINAYPDEPETKATLLTGSVKVSKGTQAVFLRPGQQAQTRSSSEPIMVNSEIDVAGVTAWKDGLFSFERAGTEAVMRQLARWYDVEVSYEGTIPARQFVGTIPRNVPASDVLKALELNNVHFRIEGKKIIVTQ